MSDIDDLLAENLKDPEFAQAWEETEIEFQIKTKRLSGNEKGELTMRDYSKISDDELEKLCFVNADMDYLTRVNREARQQIKEGRYIVVKKAGKDVPRNNAV